MLLLRFVPYTYMYIMTWVVFSFGFGSDSFCSLCLDPDTDLPLCGPDWTVYQEADKCFKFLDERRTWDQARERCSETEGVLAPISSAEEQLFIFGKYCTFITQKLRYFKSTPFCKLVLNRIFFSRQINVFIYLYLHLFRWCHIQLTKTLISQSNLLYQRIAIGYIFQLIST